MEKNYCCKHSPIVKKILLSMLAPTILMNLTTAIGSMADTVIIGYYLDDLSLSVVTFATPIYMVINILAALFAVGGCITMGIDAGEGNKAGANKAFSIAIEMLVILSAILFAAGLFFSGTVAGWLGAGEDVFELVRIYSRIILMGAPAFALNTAFAFFIRSDGRPNLSMIGMFVSIISDLILNVVFVGYLDMGVSGAAYSTVLGSVLSILVMSVHFFSKKNTLKFSLVLNGSLVRVVKNGVSSALLFIYQFVTILIMNHLISALAGTDGIVVYTVVFNLSTVSLSVFEGISQTIQPMVSNYYGEKSIKNIKETMRLAFIITVIICGCCTLFLELFPATVPTVFGIDDAGIVANAVQAVRIYAVSMTLITINVVIGYYLQCIEESFMAAILVSLRSFVVLLMAIFSLGYIFGMNGIWAAYTVTELICLGICVLMISSKRAKLKKRGTEANIYLLDKDIEKSIECYTYCCEEKSFCDYKNDALRIIKTNFPAGEKLYENAVEYLEMVEGCITDKKGRYVEIEINAKEKKIIIRDNLDHSAVKRRIQEKFDGSSYSPVLGFNRLCLK